MGAAKRAFRARLPLSLTLSTRYQTGWNVTKCHACHAKQHDKLLGNPQENQRLETRHVGAAKRAFRARLPPILTLCTPATESAPCRQRIPANAIRKNTQLDTSKVLRLRRKMTMDTSKVFCCHENCNASSENVAKVLHLPHKTTFDV